MQHRVSFGIVDRSSRIQFVPRYNGNAVMTGIHITLPERKKKKKANNQDTLDGMDAAEQNEGSTSPEDGFFVSDLPPDGITSDDGTVNIRPLEQEEWDHMRQMYGGHVWTAVRKRKSKQPSADQMNDESNNVQEMTDAGGTSVDVNP